MTQLEKLSITFAAMKRGLLAWAAGKGGVGNTEGGMTGLSDNDNIHFTIRNQQLETISDYSNACEAKIEDLTLQNYRLKGQLRLLETANREALRSDEYVMEEIQKLLAYRIDADTTKRDFEGALRDTIFYFELGLKRGLIDSTDLVLSKLDNARWMLKDGAEFNWVFNTKKNNLIHHSISTIIPAPSPP